MFPERERGKSNRVLSLKTCNLVLICVLNTLLRPGEAGCSSRPAVNRYKWLVGEAANGWVQERNCTTSCDFVKRKFARRILRLDLSLLSLCLEQGKPSGDLEQNGLHRNASWSCSLVACRIGVIILTGTLPFIIPVQSY